MDKEKFDAVVQYFDDMNIALPTDVRNAIEDVFSENDNVEGVECYHKEDLETFQSDMTIKNETKIYLSGKNSGKITNVFTYYGSLSYALSESINLYDDEDNVLEDISNIEAETETIVDIPTDYCVVLLEVVEWNSETGKHEKQPKLYIYCPESSEDEEENEITRMRRDIENGDF